MIQVEEERTARKKDTILSVLKSAGSKGVTNKELSRIALRYGGYLGLLYQEGYKIDKVDEGNGLFRYIYKSSPKEKVVRIKAIDRLMDEVEERGTVTKEELGAIMEEQNVSVRYMPNTYKNI